VQRQYCVCRGLRRRPGTTADIMPGRPGHTSSATCWVVSPSLQRVAGPFLQRHLCRETEGADVMITWQGGHGVPRTWRERGPGKATRPPASARVGR